jgi:hypothetical protein
VAEGVLDWADLKEGVRRVLATVPGHGTLATRTGGMPEWYGRGRALWSYWEIGVSANALRGAGIGTVAFESPTIIITGYAPWSYTQESEPRWDALVRETMNALLTYPTLGNLVDGWKQVGLPQLVSNGAPLVNFGAEAAEMHRAVIEMRGERYFVYSQRAEL